MRALLSMEGEVRKKREGMGLARLLSLSKGGGKEGKRSRKGGEGKEIEGDALFHFVPFYGEKMGETMKESIASQEEGRKKEGGGGVAAFDPLSYWNFFNSRKGKKGRGEARRD